MAVVAIVALIGVWWILGESILHSPAIVDVDESISRWFADHRGPRVDELTRLGSALGDTPVKIVATLAMASWAWQRFRRWQEPVMIAVPLVMEATTFIVVTHLVGRHRPEVRQLEASFVHSSFPSGHVAAAAVYGAMAVVVAWHARSRRPRVVAFAAAALITTSVALARVWRGMHHLSDVVAGALLGVVTVVFVARRLGPYVRRTDADAPQEPAGPPDGVKANPA